MVLTICAVGLLAGWPVQRDSERLNPRIGPANPRLYRSIHDARDWKNPILIIRRDGIEVISNGVLSGGRIVAPTDLQRTLIDLPLTAWRYGRVVAVQEIGLRAPDFSDTKPMADNLDVTLAILKTLEVTVERWPTA
jgi:hypothetical protein